MVSQRVVLATFGSLGDLHPYIAVGKALSRIGIRACVATSPDYRQAVETEGLEYAPMGPSLEQLGPRDELARRFFSPWRGAEYLLREAVMPYLRDSYEDITRAAQRADLLVSHPLTYTVQMVAQVQSRPWLSSVLAPFNFMSRHDPPVLAGLDLLRGANWLGPWPHDMVRTLARRLVRRWEAPVHALRQQLGLSATQAVMSFEGQFSPLGTLALFDGSLASPQADWPVNTRLCGTALYDGARPDAQLLERLHRFLGEGDPPVVFALGSSAVLIADDFWRHAIAATLALKQRAILLCGNAQLGALPSGIQAFEYLPYSEVFPHASVVVHQAGVGTLSHAMRSGRPQIATPVAFDQPDNAWRAEKLGVARVLPFRKVNTRRLCALLADTLASETQRAKAAALGVELRDADGATAAARVIAATIAANPH
jgi:rhamnosyltransferase subunit B